MQNSNHIHTHESKELGVAWRRAAINQVQILVYYKLPCLILKAPSKVKSEREREKERVAKMVVSIVVLLMLTSPGIQMEAQPQQQQLVVGFYQDKCGAAESIVREEVQKAYTQDRGIAAGLLRIYFHDCFVRGCDGSICIDSTPNNVAEKDGPPNANTLRGLEVIDNAKTRLEAHCKGLVSCADILAFAVRDSVEITRGFGWGVPAGRRDGRVSLATETTEEIPSPTSNLSQITRAFAKKGFTQQEMVALLGAHTIGRSHCFQLTNRLYNFNQTNTQDPSLNSHYAELWKQQCPKGMNDPNLVVQMNSSPDWMDSSYYADVLSGGGMFTSDQALTSSPATTAQGRLYAANRFVWQFDFAKAMVKMSMIEVLTGTAGEIRSNCRVINP